LPISTILGVTSRASLRSLRALNGLACPARPASDMASGTHRTHRPPLTALAHCFASPALVRYLPVPLSRHARVLRRPVLAPLNQAPLHWSCLSLQLNRPPSYSARLSGTVHRIDLYETTPPSPLPSSSFSLFLPAACRPSANLSIPSIYLCLA
jgi:hypothetical protein